MAARKRIIYNALGVFAGPCPASGYHFIDSDGVLNNTIAPTNGTKTNYNLLKEITRIQSVSYDVETTKTNIYQVGRRGQLNSLNLNPPTISLSFDYLQMGVLNELRMGMYCNYAQFDQSLGGAPYYSNNTGVCLISGFLDRTERRGYGDLRWPNVQRDKRNFFIPVTPDNFDLNASDDTSREIDTRANQYGVYTFGNCYFTSYKTTASVNSFPRCSVSYLCENLAFVSSGSGAEIPFVNHTTRSGVSNVNFAIPSCQQERNVPSVIMPGDITLDISSFPSITNISAIYGTGTTTSQYSTVNNAIFNFSGLNIQSYDLGFTLNREPLNSMTYKFPSDRVVKFPVGVSLGLNILVNDLSSGKIWDLVNKNDDYNISINLRNPNRKSETGLAVKYDLVRAKYQGSSFSVDIGGNQTANINFATEINPDSYQRGFFMSGLLNSDINATVDNGWLIINGGADDGSYILQEDGASKFITQNSSFFY